MVVAQNINHSYSSVPGHVHPQIHGRSSSGIGLIGKVAASQICGRQHVSSSQYHGVLHREYILVPAKVLMYDPCPLEVPEILTGAHVYFAMKLHS